MTQRIAIVGAGYAGLAAAVTLAAAGHAVTVFETSRVLGGRARKVEVDGLTVDNGQHILIGAYRDTLRLMQQVGVSAEEALLRLPLNLTYPHFQLRAPRLPAPLHMAVALLTAQGLRWGEKLAAVRFMQSLQRQHFKLNEDCTVNQLLTQHCQSENLRRYLWEPLCISALNTAAEFASAQVFANVLRDSLAADRAASDLLIPRVNLSALFAEPAARYVEAHGGSVRTQCSVGQIDFDGSHYRLDAAPDEAFTQVIIAVAPYHLPRLLPADARLDGLRTQLDALQWEPIVTCYLRYPPGTRLPQAMLGLSDGYTHWVFDRGQIDGNDGLFAAVISAKGKHQELGKDALAAAVHAELKAAIPDLPVFLSSQTITEKRATFACTPGLDRPTTRTALPGLYLAGDYVASDYPATIEGAIRSGISATACVTSSLQENQTLSTSTI